MILSEVLLPEHPTIVYRNFLNHIYCSLTVLCRILCLHGRRTVLAYVSRFACKTPTALLEALYKQFFN